MRVYTIALFLFAFNLIVGMLNDTALFPIIQAQEWDIPTNQKNYTYLGDSASEIQQGTEFGDVLKMGTNLIGILAKTVLVPGWYLGIFLGSQLHPIVLVVDALVWFVYLIGLIEFFSNRSVEPA